jgi:hypothetical protein
MQVQSGEPTDGMPNRRVLGRALALPALFLPVTLRGWFVFFSILIFIWAPVPLLFLLPVAVLILIVAVALGRVRTATGLFLLLVFGFYGSPRDHPTIMEVLAASIREHSREQWPLAAPDCEPPERTTRPDVQAAATVIARRAVRYDREPVDLESADLTRASLASARLSGAKLTDANLNAAYLDDAFLGGVDLTDANLTGVRWPSGTPVPLGWLNTSWGGLQQDPARSRSSSP